MIIQTKRQAPGYNSNVGKRIAEIALQAFTLILAKNLNLIIFPQK